MFTLAIDTATKSLSAAILMDGRVVAEIFVRGKEHHSALLLPAVDDVCRRTGVTVSQVDLFACTTGPGSFTGLRIGLATIKGFALATGRPFAGVSTLEALACNVLSASTLVCPMLDAGRGYVYTALYRPTREGKLERVADEALARPAPYMENIREACLFLGDGALKYAALIAEILPTTASLAAAPHQDLHAAAVGFLGEVKYRAGELMDPLTVAPRYLHAPEAERKRTLLAD
jgi:tRNA threonylcarbamoyladenosine biosynthesis protein TsaB